VVLNNLGIVLLSSGRASEAADAFQRAVSLAPNVKVYRENLARARKPS
jgi:Flp pilus assembly protein TadD